MATAKVERAKKAASSGRRKERTEDEGTRKAVLSAAIDTICDLGYYQASSNEIARRAGVSWGVIQYYFGTREALLLAVLEDAVERSTVSLSNARIVGSDHRMRLRQLFNLILSFYGRREYVAILQILWNLARDPRTEASTEEALVRYSTMISERWRGLFAENVDAALSHAAVSMAFGLMWGVAMEEAASAYMKNATADLDRLPIELRTEMLLDAIDGMLEHDRG